MKRAGDVVDVTGMTCPMPLIRLSQSAAMGSPGTKLTIIGDDPIFEQGVRDFCEVNNHEVVSVTPGEGRVIEICIQLGD